MQSRVLLVAIPDRYIAGIPTKLYRIAHIAQGVAVGLGRSHANRFGGRFSRGRLCLFLYRDLLRTKLIIDLSAGEAWPYFRCTAASELFGPADFRPRVPLVTDPIFVDPGIAYLGLISWHPASQ
jgi:hypothetical protein